MFKSALYDIVFGHGSPLSAIRNQSNFRLRYTILILKWCGREDSNFHGISPTATSTLRVYQFRHDRT